MSIFKKLFGKSFYNPEPDYNKSLEAYVSGDHQSAYVLIDNLLSKVNKPEMKHFAFRANVLEDMNKHQEAIADYNKAIELAPAPHNAYPFYHQIGFNYLSLRYNSEAENFYSKAIELKSIHPNTSSDPDIEAFDEGIMKGLPFARMYNNRGNARKNQLKIDEAMNDCRKAISYDKSYSNPYLLIGQLFEIKGDYSEAIKWVEKSVQLGNQSAHKILFNLKNRLFGSSPVEIQQLFDKCMLACDNGNYHEAIAGGNRLLNEMNNPAGHYVLGLAYILMDDNHYAKKHCLEFSKHNPNETNNLNRLGVAYCSLGDKIQGLYYLHKGMQLGDNNCRQNYAYWSR